MISESARNALEQVEQALQRDALEGCVFLLPSGGVIAFALTTMRGHNCRYNIGERPLRNHLRTAVGDETTNAATWFGRLRGGEARGVPKPATVWHRPHLVITEVMSPERLVTVFEQPGRIRPELLAETAEQIGIGSVEDLDELFERAVGRPLRREAIAHFRNITQAHAAQAAT